MRITSARDLGLYVRDRRRDLGVTQAQVAEAAGVSRRWLLGLENGKPTMQIGLVFRTLEALDLLMEVRPEAPSAGAVDLDALLRGIGGEPDA